MEEQAYVDLKPLYTRFNNLVKHNDKTNPLYTISNLDQKVSINIYEAAILYTKPRQLSSPIDDP